MPGMRETQMLKKERESMKAPPEKADPHSRLCADHTGALFLASHVRTPDVITRVAQGVTICLCASKVISSLVMSLLNVPPTPFPPSHLLPHRRR